MNESPDIKDMISISDAAQIRGVSHGAIQDLIKRGRLSSFEIGGRRLLSRKEVESFQPKSIGRPPKAKIEKA
jgi:excisionase family DNA binding protein